MKTKFSQALKHKGWKNWTKFVKPIVDEYNKEKIDRTSYQHQAVNRQNFSHNLSQLMRTAELELNFNSFKAGPFANEGWNKKFF